MTRSSPARRSQILTSPDRGYLSRLLSEDRNTEYSHQNALQAAQLEHERVREAAVRVFELHELKEEHNRILEQERKEQERLKAEEAIRAEELRLRELRAKSIPKPPPEPEPKPEPVQPQAPPKAPEPAKEEKPAPPSQPIPKPTEAKAVGDPRPSPSPFQQASKPPAAANPFASAASAGNAKQPAPAFSQPNGLVASKSTPTPTPPASQQPPAARPAPAPPTQPTATNPTAERYRQIHRELKNLRKTLVAESKNPGSPMKGKLGSYRREIRVSIGQLTAGKGANAKPISKITEILKEALEGRVASPPIPVATFVVEDRQPVEGAVHNNDSLPSLFIYLLNICAKGIINQFINEGGANPKAADPVGVFAAHIFSTKEFQWRGKPLIDLLIAKFRVVCPVLFGLRGNDKTEKGRDALGWKKEGPHFVPEQTHNDRMTGLGAGFAALSLRDFSKTTKSNPYPPLNYWKALAAIVNTPANETSNTQYVVLRSMIQGHEFRFLNFYGNAALAALRLALIEFPKKAPPNAAAAGSLQALTEVLRAEGLVFS